MRSLRSLVLVAIAGCTPSIGMGVGGTSGGSMYGMGVGGSSGGAMYGMSTTTGGGAMGMPPGAPAPAPPPSDPLAFMEWPTGLWWGQSDDKGHYVVLNAWGTSCRACVGALPQLEEIGKHFAGKGLHVYAINIEPDATRFPALLKTLPAYPAILVDPSGQRLAAVLGLGNIPTTWILDGNGKVVWMQEGWDNATAGALSSRLGALLGG
jgi:cytochrome c biogenesis protein CcmG, thiol:disulfide interchange protein DsbE